MQVAFALVSPHINRTVTKTPYMQCAQIYNKACHTSHFHNNCVKKEKPAKSYPLNMSKRGGKWNYFT